MSAETQPGATGRWWLPDRPDRKVPGRYVISADGGVEIELFDWIDRDPASLFDVPSLDVMPIIRGEVRGTAITLIDCTVSSAHATDRTETIWARVAVDGLGYDHQDDIRFDWVQFRVTHLDTWLYRPAYEQQMPPPTGGFSYTMRQPADLVAHVPGGEVRLRTLTSMATRVGLDVTLSQRNVFEITTDHAHDHGTLFFRYLRPLRELIRLAAVDDVEVEDERVGHRGARSDDGFPRTARIRVHRSDRPEPSERKHSSELLFTANTWSFTDNLPRWFKLDLNAAVALGLFAGATSERADITTRALQAFGAAESLHRALHAHASEPTERDVQRLARILDAAPTSKDRDWLKWKLKYAHEPSLAGRLDDLIRETGTSSQLAVGGGQRWAAEVARTRNTLAHGLADAVQLGTEIVRLYWLTEAANLLVRLRLLREIGFSDDEAAAAVQRHTYLGQIVQQIPTHLADLW